MKLAKERGQELALADLAQIRGGARLRFLRSEVELARFGRGLQQHAVGLLEPLDISMVRASRAQGRTLVDPQLAEPDGAFELQEPRAPARQLQAS